MNKYLVSIDGKPIELSLKTDLTFISGQTLTIAFEGLVNKYVIKEVGSIFVDDQTVILHAKITLPEGEYQTVNIVPAGSSLSKSGLRVSRD